MTQWGEDIGVTWDNASDPIKERFALTRLYWFFLMVKAGGPDGSDLDYEVQDQAAEAVDWWGPILDAQAQGAK